MLPSSCSSQSEPPKKNQLVGWFKSSTSQIHGKTYVQPKYQSTFHFFGGGFVLLGILYIFLVEGFCGWYGGTPNEPHHEMCDVNIADFHAVTPLRSASHNKKPRNAPQKKKYIKDYLEHLLIDDILRYVWHGSWALTGKHSQLRQKPRTTRPPHVALTSPMTTNKKEHNKKIYNSWWERIFISPELQKLCTISSIWKCLRCGCFLFIELVKNIQLKQPFIVPPSTDATAQKHFNEAPVFEVS